MAPIRLANYSIGFVELRPGEIRLIGSGTLLKVGRLSGIITARHVWDKVSEFDEIGLYQYPVRRKEIQALKEKTTHLHAVKFGSKQQHDDLGPDIAFVRVPPTIAASIEVHGTFLNFQKCHDALSCNPPNTETLDAVIGGVFEMGQKITEHGSRKTVIQEGLLNVGKATPIANGRDSFDRLEFTPNPAPDFTLPNSYGGMSGGGCFRTHFVGDEPKSMYLLGVAFYETSSLGKADKIICHGPKSIYELLFAAIKQTWGSEI